jgi:uridine kinase
VLVEGILTLSNQSLSGLFDTRIFVYTPDDVRLKRRMARDIKERGRTEESILQQWNTTVQPMHEAFCAPSLEQADIVVDGLDFGVEKIDAVWAKIVGRVEAANYR